VFTSYNGGDAYMQGHRVTQGKFKCHAPEISFVFEISGFYGSAAFKSVFRLLEHNFIRILLKKHPLPV
jgi:hypothetical protein